jgi:hypothetical protein
LPEYRRHHCGTAYENQSYYSSKKIIQTYLGIICV